MTTGRMASLEAARRILLPHESFPVMIAQRSHSAKRVFPFCYVLATINVALSHGAGEPYFLTECLCWR
ncbi:hypothetical protein KCP73_11780 [Salmonella enterica subsp. enterica]|nr:hypothetical protein KCP73_11780 [Salmonella enterica subsp. enterica]